VKHEEERNNKTLGLRLLGATSSLLLVGAVIYIAFVSINLTSSLLLTSALGGLVIPSALVSDGFLECVAGILGVFVEGALFVFEVIVGIIGSLCS
jgi:hypothetical protein